MAEGHGQLIDGEGARASDGSEGSCNVQISREELLVHRGIAVRGMHGAVPLKGERLTLVHNVASQVTDPRRARRLNWQHILSSDRVMQHFGK